MKLTTFIAPIALMCGIATRGSGADGVVTMEGLLDEMVRVERLVLWPSPRYTARQESSYDRRSVTPGDPGWFANDDGWGFVREERTDGRVEKVMFDKKGPGAITRIWITTLDKRGKWRFYFDGEAEPRLVVGAYDLMRFPVVSLDRGLLQPHTSYQPEGRGGNTLFLPIPYAEGCKITFEDESGVEPTPKYYGINYRRYAPGTRVETYSAEVAERAAAKIALTDSLLLNPPAPPAGERVGAERLLTAGESLTVELPSGERAVYLIRFNVSVGDSADFARQMRELAFGASFDGKQTVMAPLSDFSGGGAGAPRVESWYLTSDGRGEILSRWLMPYRKGGFLRLTNRSRSEVKVRIQAVVSPLEWNDRSLYFHCAWREQTRIPVHKFDEPENCADWNFAAIDGRGLYVGDALSLFNHAPRWYGEGDEKIWVDGEEFPSHFGTGTEDYYNSSWAPVVPFHTPFGGAPRADSDTSHGYNSWLRTRNLDAIPFESRFRFDIEMMGWQRGLSDYATTIFWYGDRDSKAIDE